jgi:hypothetical protein
MCFGKNISTCSDFQQIQLRHEKLRCASKLERSNYPSLYHKVSLRRKLTVARWTCYLRVPILHYAGISPPMA